jgi:hypothetical protein
LRASFPFMARSEVTLTADEYVHLSGDWCGFGDEAGALPGRTIVLRLRNICKPIARLGWHSVDGSEGVASLANSSDSLPDNDVLKYASQPVENRDFTDLNIRILK